MTQDAPLEPELPPEPPPIEGAPEDVDEVAAVLHTLPRHAGWLERFAVAFLTRHAGHVAPADDPPHEDPVHVLTRSERIEVRRVVESTVLRAFLAGVVSALLVAATAIATELHPVPHRLAWLFAAAIVATLFEVTALYLDHLHGMLRLMRATGARLTDGTETIGEALANAMARAALELPDPVRIVDGIDPWRETSRWRLAVAVAVYKLKRGLTNFFAKFLLREVAPSTLIRVYAPAVSLPITGAWNAFVSWRVLHEARIRVIGPSAVEEVYALLLPASCGEECHVALFRAVGMGMVLKRSVHPNLLAMLRGLVRRFGSVREAQIDHRKRFLQCLLRLSRDEQGLVLQVLQVATVIDGRLVGRERALVREARVACGLSPGLSPVERLLSRFSRGDPIDRDLLSDLAR